MNKKFTIITTVYNGEKTIEKTINSVISQKFNNYEYIIVDALSNDNTLAIVSKYKQHISKIISEPDKSIYEGMNKGIKNANGEIIVIINSGDTFSENALEIVNNYFENYEHIDFLFRQRISLNVLPEKD